MKQCTAPGCDEKHWAKGLCESHYDARRNLDEDRQRKAAIYCRTKAGKEAHRRACRAYRQRHKDGRCERCQVACEKTARLCVKCYRAHGLPFARMLAQRKLRLLRMNKKTN